VKEDDVARGTTGAPRNTGRDTITANVPGATTEVGRLAGIVSGRRAKYLVVALWILVTAATASFAGKLLGAEMGLDSTLLYATLGVVVVLLLLTYRSPVLWLLPVISAGVALTGAQAAIHWLTQHTNLTVTGQTEGIVVVLVVGASTNYAVLLIARYREELHWHADRHIAMAVALRRAAASIIASGLTVVAGLGCLLAAEPDKISGLGPAAAIGVVTGLIAMVTLLPAMLVVCGRWIFWPARPGYQTAGSGRHAWWPSSLSLTSSSAELAA
jgi:RND superfamily putative drug exporter